MDTKAFRTKDDAEAYVMQLRDARRDPQTGEIWARRSEQSSAWARLHHAVRCVRENRQAYQRLQDHIRRVIRTSERRPLPGTPFFSSRIGAEPK